MIRIMARITAHRERSGELRAILATLAEPSRTEPGCLRYEVFQDEDDPVEFITVEEWASDAAADAHMLAPHVVEAVAKARPLLAAPPAIHRFRRLA